jgi:hypothetical protein
MVPALRLPSSWSRKEKLNMAQSLSTPLVRFPASPRHHPCLYYDTEPPAGPTRGPRKGGGTYALALLENVSGREPRHPRAVGHGRGFGECSVFPTPPRGGAVLVRPANAARSRLPLRGQAGRKASTPSPPPPQPPPLLVTSVPRRVRGHSRRMSYRASLRGYYRPL